MRAPLYGWLIVSISLSIFTIPSGTCKEAWGLWSREIADCSALFHVSSSLASTQGGAMWLKIISKLINRTSIIRLLVNYNHYRQCMWLFEWNFSVVEYCRAFKRHVTSFHYAVYQVEAILLSKVARILKGEYIYM